ncbi:MAG TPA: DUF2156 domain-containing protein [Thermoanaerobaculia bacterium]|jgi:lysylphosphatidylglycerol synthetase-like protein (DUF2156 family)|nr:DUF2156 domain-containing protein [Thermoanaerobaculia bacterium]
MEQTIAVAFKPQEVINHTSGFLALSAQNQRYTVEGLSGFIAFREQGKHLISIGGVHAPPDSRERLLDAFLAEAEKRRRHMLAVQVPESQAQLFVSRGFTVNQMGSSYGRRLDKFNLKGTRHIKLRNKIKRAREAGMYVCEIGREIPADESAFALVRDVSATWLRGKKKKELDFMIGEIGTPEDKERRTFVVFDGEKRAIGFITYVPVWGEYPGYLHDLTRRVPEAPPGAMELCNLFAIERFVAEGVAHLHFGFTPFIVDEKKRPFEKPFLAWVIEMLGRYGKIVYPAQSQVAYKLKWGPDIIEREFIACRALSLRAVFDLLILTRSI